MNRKLTDYEIESTWRSLIARHGLDGVSGRQLRMALRKQYGAAGSTNRVFTLFHRLSDRAREGQSSTPHLHARILELEQQLAAAIAQRDAALQRAVLAEEREVAHQDRWANEIHELRQTVQRLQATRRSLPFPT